MSVPEKVASAIEFLSEWAAAESINADKEAGRDPYHDRERLVACISMGIQAHMFDPDYETADSLDMGEEE